MLELVKGGGTSASQELHVELRVAPGCFVEPARGTATRLLTVKLGLSKLPVLPLELHDVNLLLLQELLQGHLLLG